MTSTLSCEALRDDIIALLYDDGEPAERSRAGDHLAQCVPCRIEYTELKGVRKAMGNWSLPTPKALPQTRPGVSWLPTGLAAAAGLVLGIGVAVAGRSAFSTSPNSQNAAAPDSVAQKGSSSPFVSHDQLQELLASQESRHRAELAALRRTLVSAPEAPSQGGSAQKASNLSPGTVERLLKESEQRQTRLVEARLAGLRTENDLQRQYDMAQIAAGLAYIDSRTGADAARTSELMKNLVRVTAKPQDR